MVTHMHIGPGVEDSERWKEGYDASVEHREAAGEVSYWIFRNADDPSVVTAVSEQESAERVQAFLDSPSLEERTNESRDRRSGPDAHPAEDGQRRTLIPEKARSAS